MNRRFVDLILACIVLSNCGWGQEIKIFNRKVQAHGFVSQGFVYTNQNNWLTMDTSKGSAAMTEMGLNASSQLTDKLRIGAQVYDRNLGQLGQWHPSLDWALADYRFRNWFGVRAGKVKTTLGLYNDSQDLDFLRVFALLPQSVYPTDMCEVTIAHTGWDLYGNIMLPRHLGDLSYTAYAGRRSDSMYSGYPYLEVQWLVFFKELGGLQYGGDLRWNTPLKGLTLGGSRLNQELTGRGKFISLLNPSGPLLPYETSTKKDWTNQFYAEFLFRRFRLDGEYRRSFHYVPYIPGADVSTDARSWYIAGTYRIHNRLEIGSYYSRNTIRELAGGLRPLWPLTIPTRHIRPTTFTTGSWRLELI